jgi:hypothetical protein
MSSITPAMIALKMDHAPPEVTAKRQNKTVETPKTKLRTVPTPVLRVVTA